MTPPRPVECWLTDMDGVLVHEEAAIPGAPKSAIWTSALATARRLTPWGEHRAAVSAPT